MIKAYLFLAFAAITGLLQAQIPNAGFEDWTSAGSYETPDQWGNMNAATASSNVYTTIKGSPGASGNHYIKLTTRDVGGVITPGMIVSGQLNTETWQASSGFPFNQRVDFLTGRYQFMGYNDDVATIAAWLTRWDAENHRRDTVASLRRNTTGMIHVWTDFSIPFVYLRPEVPDTAIVFISSSNDKPKKNSFIWLDDLAFEGTSAGVSGENETASGFSVHFNRASGRLCLSFNSSTGYTARMLVTDLQGKVLSVAEAAVAPGPNQTGIDLEKQRMVPGIYVVQLQTPQGLVSGKFVLGP